MKNTKRIHLAVILLALSAAAVEAQVMTLNGSDTSVAAESVTQGFFDNVRLSAAAAVPEPSSVALMLAGGLTLLASFARRTKSRRIS